MDAGKSPNQLVAEGGHAWWPAYPVGAHPGAAADRAVLPPHVLIRPAPLPAACCLIIQERVDTRAKVAQSHRGCSWYNRRDEWRLRCAAAEPCCTRIEDCGQFSNSLCYWHQTMRTISDRLSQKPHPNKDLVPALLTSIHARRCWTWTGCPCPPFRSLLLCSSFRWWGLSCLRREGLSDLVYILLLLRHIKAISCQEAVLPLDAMPGGDEGRGDAGAAAPAVQPRRLTWNMVVLLTRVAILL